MISTPQIYEVPQYIENGIESIGLILEALGHTTNVPTQNVGEKFSNEVFILDSYDWSTPENEPEPPNFKYDTFEVHWYKSLGRGMEMNMEMDFKTWLKIYCHCLKSLGIES